MRLVERLGGRLDALELAEVPLVVPDHLLDHPRAKGVVVAPGVGLAGHRKPVVGCQRDVDVVEAEDRVREVVGLPRALLAPVGQLGLAVLGEPEVLAIGLVLALDPLGPALLLELVEDGIDGAVGGLPVTATDGLDLLQDLVAIAGLLLQ